MQITHVVCGEIIGIFDDDTSSKRTLGIRDKLILYRNAEKKCQNCGNPLEFDEMQVGHKKAASKGGMATLKNCVCLCYGCNHRQGTDDWNKFQQKQGKTIQEDNTKKMKNRLEKLGLRELKFLAQKHNIRVKRKIEEGFFETTQKAPSKIQYIKKLAKSISEEEINSVLKEIPPPPQKKRIRRKSSEWSW